MTTKLNIDNGVQGWKTEHQTVTKAIFNKGLSGNSSILPRSNFRVGGQETTQQSLTSYIASTVILFRIPITENLIGWICTGITNPMSARRGLLSNNPGLKKTKEIPKDFYVFTTNK